MGRPDWKGERKRARLWLFCCVVEGREALVFLSLCWQLSIKGLERKSDPDKDTR